MAMFGPAMQILVAILLVILLFVIGFFIYNMELAKSIRDAGKLKKETVIFNGIKDLKIANNETYNTVNKNDMTYRDISPSVNQGSGAEFSYNFWLYLDSSAFDVPVQDNIVRPDSGLAKDDLILLVHGDKTPYTYKNLCNTDKKDIMVKCPLIKIQRGGDVLAVEFNTMSSPDAVHEQSRNTCTETSTDWSMVNSYKIALSGLRNKEPANYNKKWFMVTVIIQDTSPTDPLPLRNKVRCRILVNGVTELDRFVDGGLNAHAPSLLRQNLGFLHVAPVVTFGSAATDKTLTVPSARQVYMADLSYFNYALNVDEVKSMYKSGYNKQYALSASQSDPDTAFMTEQSVAGDKKSFYAF
jgi:hypothetical protein